MVWIETPTNPLLKLIDIKAVADVAHKTEVKRFTNSYFHVYRGYYTAAGRYV